jgi:hypothetical protein
MANSGKQRLYRQKAVSKKTLSKGELARCNHLSCPHPWRPWAVGACMYSAARAHLPPSFDKRAQEKSPADIVCIEAAVDLEYGAFAEIALEDVAVVADGS